MICLQRTNVIERKPKQDMSETPCVMHTKFAIMFLLMPAMPSRGLNVGI